VTVPKTRRTKTPEPAGPELKLKVTVTGDNPDRTAALMSRLHTQVLSAGPYKLTVTCVERADGQPLGAEAEFEEWWAESHCEGDDGEPQEKSWALEAFLYALGRKEQQPLCSRFWSGQPR
jgi:hypothetical protein